MSRKRARLDNRRLSRFVRDAVRQVFGHAKQWRAIYRASPRGGALHALAFQLWTDRYKRIGRRK